MKFPLVCLKCGQFSVQRNEGDECPHCSSFRALTITEEDPRYIVFYSMMKRCSFQVGTSKLIPTNRETALFNHGDQILFEGFLVRVVAKTYGRQGADPRFWLKSVKYKTEGTVITDDGNYRMHKLPPAVPAHVLNLLSRQEAESHIVLPISFDSESKEAVFLSRGLDFQNVANMFPDQRVVFWEANPELIQKGIRYFYSEESIAICQSAEFECSRSVLDLDMTDAIDVRYCDQCDERVYLVEDRSAERFHSKKGHCVARLYVDRPRNRVFLGKRL